MPPKWLNYRCRNRGAVHFIASPFFTPYLLENLGFSYLAFTIVNSCATLSSILVMKRWGTHSDSFGNIKILSLASVLISLVPLLWLFSPKPEYLILVQLFSGFSWAGFNLAAANFIYDAVKPGMIAKYLSYQNTIIGGMVLAGGMLGSAVAEAARQLPVHNYLVVFVVSAAFRMVITAYFLPRISEVRQVQHISRQQLFFKMASIRPMQGLVAEQVIMLKKAIGRR